MSPPPVNVAFDIPADREQQVLELFDSMASASKDPVAESLWALQLYELVAGIHPIVRNLPPEPVQFSTGPDAQAQVVYQKPAGAGIQHSVMASGYAECLAFYRSLYDANQTPGVASRALAVGRFIYYRRKALGIPHAGSVSLYAGPTVILAATPGGGDSADDEDGE
jgi:hypothetical protein